MKKLVLVILTFTTLLCSGGLAFAIPQGQSVESGDVTFNQPDAKTLNIATGNNAVVNFNGGFNINHDETVNVTPLGNAVNPYALFRDKSGGASLIEGNLFARGITLFLVNTNGIYIGPDGNIQANNFIASTLDISTNNFINQRYIFEHDPQKIYAEILNKGTIAANNVALIGSAIENKGIILARAGTINLASGDKTTVSFDSHSLIQVEINEETSGQVFSLEDGKSLNAAIANSGTLQAQVVVMTAKTAKDIFEYAVNQTGIVRGTGLVEENGTIRIVANRKVQVSGTLEAPQGNIKVTSDESVVIDHPLNLTGDTTITSNTEDILIHDQITQSQGALTLNAPQGGIYNSGLPIQAKDLILISPTINTPTQAENLTLYRNGKNMNLSNCDITGNFVTLKGGSLLITYPLSTNLTLRSNDAINAEPGIIIQANTVRLISNKFGTTTQPIYVNASFTYIDRLTGNIDILESQGSGNTMMLRGPPDLGAIIYSAETNLTLQALEGSVNVVKNASISANNLTLKTKGSIYSEGSLITAHTINLLADGAITSLGVLKADRLIERGASFLVGGVSEVGSADMANADNAVTYNTGNYAGTYSDAVDIIINDNAVITLTGATTFQADSDANGTGAFIMNAGSSIVGGGYNLTIYASQASTLTSITGVGNLTLRASKTGSNPTYTANSALSVNNTATITSCTLFMNSYDLAVSSIVNNGTLRGANYYVDATGGNDNNPGTCQGKTWKTIAKVNTASFNAGDSVLFNRGDTWLETLTFPSSGTASLPITISSYGSGNLPVMTDLTLILQSYINISNIKCLATASVRALNCQGSHDINFTGIECDGGGIMNNSFSSLTYIAPWGSAVSYNITFNDCIIHSGGNQSGSTSGGGLEFHNCHDILVEHCTIYNFAEVCLEAYCDTGYSGNNIIFKNNTVYEVAGYYSADIRGINVGWGCTNAVVNGNYVKDCTTFLISADAGSSGTIIENNILQWNTEFFSEFDLKPVA